MRQVGKSLEVLWNLFAKKSRDIFAPAQLYLIYICHESFSHGHEELSAWKKFPCLLTLSKIPFDVPCFSLSNFELTLLNNKKYLKIHSWRVNSLQTFRIRTLEGLEHKLEQKRQNRPIYAFSNFDFLFIFLLTAVRESQYSIIRFRISLMLFSFFLQ